MNNKGFTLIELVVVIVILGILAATVAPKFIKLQAEARTSTLHGVKAAMEGAAAMVYGKSIVAGNQNLPSADDPTITLNDGTELAVGYGYPLSDSDDWKQLLELNAEDFLMFKDIHGVLVVFPVSVGFVFSSDEDCIVSYRKATSTAKPIITVRPCV